MLQTFTHSRATEVDVNSHAIGDTPIPSSIVVESVTEKMDDDEDEAIEGMESSFGEFEKIDESPEVNQDEEGEMGVMSIECVGFCPSLPWVASGGMDKTLKVWDTVSGTCRCVCSHGGSVVVLRWHPSLPVVTTAALDNFVRLWDARGGEKGLHQ